MAGEGGRVALGFVEKSACITLRSLHPAWEKVLEHMVLVKKQVI